MSDPYIDRIVHESRISWALTEAREFAYGVPPSENIARVAVGSMFKEIVRLSEMEAIVRDLATATSLDDFRDVRHRSKEWVAQHPTEEPSG